MVDVGSTYIIQKWICQRIGGKRREENIQEVHVKVEIEVCIRDVLAIPYVPHIPDWAIEGLANFSKNGSEGAKLAAGIISMLIRHTMYKDESETDEVLHGFEEGRTILEAFVGDEEVFTLLDVDHVP